ncbi:MAG: M23 family metallopeptidase [Alphaproteobacteria bacterium]
MINFITRYFSSLWSLITWPFRAIWHGITRMFPPREFTIMDIPRGNVYSFEQSSFWRFTKFCGKLGLIIWASWATYIFIYHRPLLQKRTMQLAEETAKHERHMYDLQTYLAKYNDLTRDLNVLDDKILTDKKLSDKDTEELMNERVKIWGELDFLHAKLVEMFQNPNYNPEYTKVTDLSLEYEMVLAENAELKKMNTSMIESMAKISDADNEIVETVTKMTAEHTEELQNQLKTINSTLISLGATKQDLIDNANKFASPLVGKSFSPLNLDQDFDPKYQKLAQDIELWNGLQKLTKILPLGAPVENVRVTSNFGIRTDPFEKTKKKHKGIDFAGKIGTELMAVAPGRVVSAGERVGYGITVEIDHGLGFSTLYAHLSKINVSRGDWVKPGTIVGLGGSTGRSTGPHLHYEIRYKGTPFDPKDFIKTNQEEKEQ